jgi:ubiquinone/menaquinone biosynthesis C-methylase UbiE
MSSSLSDQIMTTSLTSLQLVCPECRSVLSFNGALHCNNGHEFRCFGGVWDLLPKSLAALTAEEGKYHADQKATWVEQNQIDTLRNLDVHRSFLKAISAQLNRSSRILEIGGGVGFDLKLLLEIVKSFDVYVFSEVSLELVTFAALEVQADKVAFCTLDAQRIPFADHEFDCVFMVAAFHHLPAMSETLAEIARVTKPAGFIALGIEPNRWWLALMKHSRWFLRTILAQKAHSAADEEALGLARADFEELARVHDLRILRFEPVWLLCGCLHYGLEFLHRMLRSKKRRKVPAVLERLFIATDRILLKIPGVRQFSSHNSVIYQKR